MCFFPQAPLWPLNLTKKNINLRLCGKQCHIFRILAQCGRTQIKNCCSSQPAGRLDYTADNIFPNSPTQMLIQNWPLVGANNSSWHTVGLLDHSIENFLEPKTNNFHVIRRLLLLSIFWLTTTKCFRFHFHLPVNNWNI